MTEPPTNDLNAGFDWREVPRESEAAAKFEAERQQAMDDPEVAEWIYLRNPRIGNQWVARRTPRNVEVPVQKPPWWQTWGPGVNSISAP